VTTLAPAGFRPVPAVGQRRTSEALAVAAAAALVLADVAVAFGVGEAVPFAALGAALGRGRTRDVSDS
jgi:hypothetical protein